LQHREVNTVKITPSHLGLLRSLEVEKTGISKIILGGEQLQKELVRFLTTLNPGIDIYNEYGPTETTVGCTCALIKHDIEDITIGRPIYNTNVYIIDADGNPLPPGIPGEIWISGPGVSPGYFNDPDKTREKFLDKEVPAIQGRFYKSGDAGKWLYNGLISYIGRKDNQVKVRGVRIEPGEIEYYLEQHPAILSAIVLVRKDEDNDELCAFFTSADKVEIASVIAHMKASLPKFMIPDQFFQVKEFPLTPNGKLDKAALLRKYIKTAPVTKFVPARNELEGQVARIWQQVLGREEVGVFDDFFTLGGHSLKATRLMTGYKKHFGVNFSLEEIFLNPTIELHTNLIANATKDQIKELPVAAMAADYQLSHAQKTIVVDLSAGQKRRTL